MISVTQANKIIAKHALPLPAVVLPLRKAAGHLLAANLYAPSDSPPFEQAAMDGYAFSYSNWDKQSPLEINGEMQAGCHTSVHLGNMQTARIFTGAPMPVTADTVVMQEMVTLHENEIVIHDKIITSGANVRPQGSHIRYGNLALQAGVRLSPAAITFLASIGVENVPVYPKPSVAVIVTGKELVQPGDPLAYGQVYECNSCAIASVLESIRITPAYIKTADDKEEEIRTLVKNQLDSDILILTGGISTGNYDCVRTALQNCGVTEHFYKVKQKPGKPLFFGTHGKTLVFGLPGNPASVLCCFYEYVVPAISNMTGMQYFKKLTTPLAAGYEKKTGLTYFLKGKLHDHTVEILPHQESYKMNSFAIADCLVVLEEEESKYCKGECVDVHMIV